MFRYLTRLVQVALISTLGLGGGVALLIFTYFVVIRGQQDAGWAAVTAGLVIGLAFSTVMVIIMVALDLTARTFIAKGSTNSLWDVEQKRELVVDGSAKQIVAACRQALLAVPNVTSVSDDPESMSARASTGASWRSPGEEMEVGISQIDGSKWQVKCISRSKSPKALFDYGKNFENVETWQRRIDMELRSLAKAP